MRGVVLIVAVALSAASAAVSLAGETRETAAIPVGTFLTKITQQDLYRAALSLEDAHWETLELRQDGTWRAVWFHPRHADQPPATGTYTLKGATIRFLGTPDTVRWRYAGSALRFTVVHVPDALARLTYTAHPWRKIR